MDTDTQSSWAHVLVINFWKETLLKLPETFCTCLLLQTNQTSVEIRVNPWLILQSLLVAALLRCVNPWLILLPLQ